MEDRPKRWVIFTLFVYCMFRATRYEKKILKQWKKNYWTLFWYINKLVPSGTEATVLLNVYPVFVSKFDFNIRLLIEERITTLPKMFLLLSSSFLSRIQQKESRGTDIFGLCFVNMTELVLCCSKNYLDTKSPYVYTVYGRKIRLRLVQLNLVSLGTKEIFLAIVLLCKLYCG